MVAAAIHDGFKNPNQELEERVKGVVIIDSESGLPLFTRMTSKMDSIIFSGLITAINSLTVELTFGSLSSFTTESNKVFVTAEERVTVAVFLDNVDDSIAHQLTSRICNEFVEKYSIPFIPNTKDYLGFNHTLDLILHEFFFKEDTKKNLLFIHDGSDHFILANIVSIEDIIDQSIVIHCNILNKKIYIVHNCDNVPPRLKYIAQREAKRINNEISNNQFTIRDVYDRVELESMFSLITGEAA